MSQTASPQAVKRNGGRVSSADNQAAKLPIKLPFLPLEVPENVYTGFEAIVVIFEAAIIDAAYSGDWVRIGAITTGEGKMGDHPFVCSCI